ncbi:MAG: O-antigen ligase family protein [Candidatus Cloacimonetes bacterium]|nr:O-antigen ligase family protein [Candidatus Cloacimonadota bacterium]
MIEKESLTSNSHSLRLFTSLLAFLAILLISTAFALFTMASWTVFFYFVIGYLLVTESKVGLVAFALSYHIIFTSFNAVTGTYLPQLFYGVFVIVLLLIFYANVIGFQIRLPSLKMDKYVLIMILYLAISVFFITPDRDFGSEKLRNFITNVILFYIPILLVKLGSDFNAVVKGIVIFGAFFTGFCLLSLFGLETFFGGDIHGRFSTLGLNSIWVARHLTFSILANLYFIKIYLEQPEKNIGKISILIFLVLLQGFLTFLTGSRGPLLSIIVAIAFIVLISIRLRFFYIIVIALVSIILVLAFIQFMPSHIADRLLSRDPKSQITVQLRLAANLQALELFWQNKIAGAGLGSFRGVSFLRFPHNVFTETLAELGLIGFSIFMLILLAGVNYLIKMSKKIDRSILYLIIAFFITAVVNINFGELIGGTYYLYFSLGLIYCARVLSLDQEEKKELSTNEQR